MLPKREPNKILIVDDDLNVRSILAQHLAGANCECVTSENAFDALNKIKRTAIGLAGPPRESRYSHRAGRCP